MVQRNPLVGQANQEYLPLKATLIRCTTRGRRLSKTESIQSVAERRAQKAIARRATQLAFLTFWEVASILFFIALLEVGQPIRMAEGLGEVIDLLGTVIFLILPRGFRL